MEAERYPFSLEGLGKGSIINASVIEHAYGISRTDPRYRRMMMRARAFVMRELDVTVECEDACLRILEDAEAARYNRRWGRLRLRAFVRTHRRNLAVDVRALSESQRKEHERTLLVHGAIIVGIRRSAAVALQAVRRQTPGRIAGVMR